ncbi:MAG: FlgD immunoglobulin-like domain containing protein [Candidatus Eiseniibacteriota bacterium]
MRATSPVPAARLASAFIVVTTTVLALAPMSALGFTLEAWTLNPRSLDQGPPHVWVRDGAGAHEFIHWDLREFANCTVPWSAHNGTGDIAGLAEFTEIGKAFDLWEAVVPARIRFTRVVAPVGAMAPFNLDGNNMLGFGAGLPAGTLGETATWAVMGSGRMIESDILFNDPSYVWVIAGADQAATPTGAEVLTVAAHEIGHFIGLGHVPAGPDVDAAPRGNFPGAEDTDANGDAVLDTPMMDSPTQTAMWHLHDDDEDGCNFLYNPDLGDAPDAFQGTPGEYPSIVRRGSGRTLNGVRLRARAPGAEHIFGIKERQPGRNYTYEWLGRPGGTDNVNSECESRQVDRDAFDDGVTLVPNPPIWGKPLFIINWVRYANDHTGMGHDYATHNLWVSTWLDLNQNGVWAAGEKYVHGNLAPGSPGGVNADDFDVVVGGLILPKFLPKPNKPVWLRSRLDWGEDVGALFNIDGNLAEPAGAAQFGEVEDYPIKCLNPYRQLILTNTTPSTRTGIGWVTAGDSRGVSMTFSAYVDAMDCILEPPITDPVLETYSLTSDETTIDYPVPTTVPPGRRIHTGRCQPDEVPLYPLRTYWQPLLPGAPTIQDYIPVTNASVFALYGGDEGDVPQTRLWVGAPDAPSGGVLAGDPLTGVWNGTMQTFVTARISPTFFPLEQLSLCNPQIQALLPMPLGGGSVTPDHPLEFLLPGIGPHEHLILEVRSLWSLNNNQATELIQVRNPSSDAVDVPEPTPGASRLALSSRPLPFRGSSTIEYRLPVRGSVRLAVYDVRGTRLRVLEDGTRDAGPHTVTWDGRDGAGRRVAPGIYFYVLNAGGETARERTILLH